VIAGHQDVPIRVTSTATFQEEKVDFPGFDILPSFYPVSPFRRVRVVCDLTEGLTPINGSGPVNPPSFRTGCCTRHGLVL